ncbi:NAD(P)/FAD-dependent oxidoreductase [Hyphomicrobium sp.]|uniref:NAD(P)/FAD-dependent oxidoreductase n=1 Tax=Hyphomicrobium sp. TaxID=82 RepID=UPI002E36D82E|nr:FAD-dependent monooxygenase [Hyphomicrobium sp.]HEX2841645.1 FAD-dependent monooxygenase [Hyphomicrobium sp.]
MDAIAAGGGLAGTAFAIELARAGAKITLIERTAGPHHKVCGDFLSGEARTLLRHLGIDPLALGGNVIKTLSLADRASEARAPLPFDAIGLSRFRLDEMLLAAATSAGVTVLRGTTVEGIDESGGNVLVRTPHGTYGARVAALASGKHNIRGISRAPGSMVGLKMHLEPTRTTKDALEALVRLMAFPGGYVGACLVENDTLSIAWNIENASLTAIGRTWNHQRDYIARASPPFASIVHEAKPLWEKPVAVSGLPYGFLRTEPISARIYPIGDQLAVIPSFAGDGTSLALASGIAAARAVLSGENADTFQRRLIAGYRGQFRIVGTLDRVIANPIMRRAAIALAGFAPQLVTRIAGATRMSGYCDLAERAHTLEIERSKVG